MNHIKLYEGFSTLSEFRALKPGDIVKYMGDTYEVEEADGNVLKLTGEDGNSIDVNFGMFTSKGMIPDMYKRINTRNLETGELEEEELPSRSIIFTSRQNRDIIITIVGGRIATIDNKAGIRFPFDIGQTYTRSIETWACNNSLKMDGKDPCPEEKIFGMRKSDIPQGHELRMLFPGKFRK
jgi:hypothetical protein